MAIRKQVQIKKVEWEKALLAVSAVGHLMQIADRKRLAELLDLTQHQVNQLLANEAVLKEQFERLRREYESFRAKAQRFEELNTDLNKRVRELEKELAIKQGKGL